MGIGLLGGHKLKCPSCGEEFADLNIVFKRKFRWTIEGETSSGKFEPLFVKVNSRPKPDIEETEINFLSGKMWIPGKQHWDQITVSTWDLEKDTDLWQAVQGSMHDPATGECPPEKYGKFVLRLYDGCGCLIESWEFPEAYIAKVSFSELDHSSSECLDVEFDIRYKNVVYKNALQDGESKYLPGILNSHKVTCPHCKHEFQSGPNPNIVF